MPKLSCIIPFAQEHPQAAFTVHALYLELRDRCDFEIIAIDNTCPELEHQLLTEKNLQPDAGGKYLASFASGKRPWYKYLEYKDKLSHWQAKNLGVENSTGDVLFFCDAHCLPSQGSIVPAFNYYLDNFIDGTLHMPLSYFMDTPGNELMYKLHIEPETAVVHYKFTKYRTQHPGDPGHLRVPCMSTCGMMMRRSLYDEIGGWPRELGIYGGGENFINFTLAILGKSINVFHSQPLYHYAAPRGYHWNYDDFHRNRTISTYIYGGRDMALKYCMNIKGGLPQKTAIWNSVDQAMSVWKHRKMIEAKQVISIEDWIKQWQP